MSKKTLNVVLGVVAILIVCLIGLFLFIPKGSGTPAFSTPTDQKTDPMPTNPTSTPQPVTPNASVSTPQSETIPFASLPDPDYPWEDYHYPIGEARDSVLDFYPKGESVDLTIAPGADIISYAESLGYTHYAGDGNLNFFYGDDEWDSPDVKLRVSYYAPQGYFCLSYWLTGNYYNIFCFYPDSPELTIGDTEFSVELAEIMKHFLGRMWESLEYYSDADSLSDWNVALQNEIYSNYLSRYSVTIAPDLTVFMISANWRD